MNSHIWEPCGYAWFPLHSLDTFISTENKELIFNCESRRKEIEDFFQSSDQFCSIKRFHIMAVQEVTRLTVTKTWIHRVERSDRERWTNRLCCLRFFLHDGNRWSHALAMTWSSFITSSRIERSSRESHENRLKKFFSLPASLTNRITILNPAFSIFLPGLLDVYFQCQLISKCHRV